MDVKDIYKMIPKFECKKGCSACCGIVPIIPQEAKNLNLKKAFVLPFSGLTCKYSCKEGCKVYEDRPLLCRLYGVVHKMPCTCGGKPERMLSLEEEDKIMSAYKLLGNGMIK